MLLPEQLMDHRAMVYHYAMGMVHDHAVAEDIVSQTMMQGIRGLAKFRGESKVSTWLVRIARNEALMHIRKMHAKRRAAEVPLDEASALAMPFDVVDELMWRERLDTCVEEIARLSPLLREAMLMYIVCDGEIKALALALGISEYATKTRVFRARRRLKKKMGHAELQ